MSIQMSMQLSTQLSYIEGENYVISCQYPETVKKEAVFKFSEIKYRGETYNHFELPSGQPIIIVTTYMSYPKDTVYNVICYHRKTDNLVSVDEMIKYPIGEVVALFVDIHSPIYAKGARPKR